MPANTTQGFPYPLGTDPISDGDDAIKNLAQAVDDKVGVLASGSLSINITALNTPTSANITFPAGRFAVAPSLALLVNAGDPRGYDVSYTNITATGVTVTIVQASGTTGARTVLWIAHQGS